MKGASTLAAFVAFLLVAPGAEGRAQPLLGVDFVQWDGMPCERMGWRRPYEEHNAASYASRKEWEDETLARLKSWGFNMLGACCDDSLRHRGLSHTIFLNMTEGFCKGDDDRWISRYANVPNTALPNVFHPDFAAHCDAVAREMCAANRGDADLLGYYIDNELVWQGRRGAPLATGLFDTVRGKRERHSARRALLAFLRGEGVADFAAFDALPPERRRRLKAAFTEFFAERYFNVTTGAIRRHDPGHLVLGCRFAGMDGAPPEVWKAAGRFCDVITFNCYPWADLDRNVVLDAKGGVPVATRFANIHALTGRPLLISEWSFPALDAGCPCLNGAGQRFRTQGGESRWIPADDVKSVAFEREGVCGTLVIVAAGRDGECSFNLTHRVTVAPGKSDFLCEVAGIENTGSEEFAVQRFYMSSFAAEARPAIRKGVPNLWKGERKCCWLMSDGRSYGMASGDDAAECFNLWLDGDGNQHPDIDFSLQSPLMLAPRDVRTPPRPMTAIASLAGA